MSRLQTAQIRQIIQFVPQVAYYNNIGPTQWLFTTPPGIISWSIFLPCYKCISFFIWILRSRHSVSNRLMAQHIPQHVLEILQSFILTFSDRPLQMESILLSDFRDLSHVPSYVCTPNQGDFLVYVIQVFTWQVA